MATRRRFWTTYVGGVLISSLLVMEIAVRFLGYTAWNPDTSVNIIVEPGRSLTQIDSLLGYKHLAGAFHVTLPTGLEFDMTHGENTLRATRATDTYLDDTLHPEIWVFGGSFTHGWSIEDYETFPWLLQENLPDFDVVNFGVGGYGTIQSSLKISELLSAGRRPHLIVLAYSALHDERNTFMRSRVKEVSAWNHLGEMRQPAARIIGENELDIRYRDVAYRSVPFTKYLAVAHCLDMAINKIQHMRIDSHAVTRSLLLRTSNEVNAQGVPIVLASIYDGPQTATLLSWADSSGFSTVDISVDLADSGMSNRPYDAHPSALANELYAQRLLEHLRDNNFVNRER